MSRCRSCGADIIWAVTNKGKLIPIDAEPTPKGNIQLQSSGGRTPLAEVHTIKAPGLVYYQSHFASCPERKQWRKKDETDSLGDRAGGDNPLLPVR